MTLLSLESPAPVVKQGTKWQLTTANVSEVFWTRVERLTALRRAEQQQMQAYIDLPFGAHMAFLIQALDGDVAGVLSPRLPPLPSACDPELVKQAIRFLKRTNLVIEPRLQWPQGGLLAYRLQGKIPPQLQAQLGRVLCAWGDAGWGEQVRLGKYQDGYFSDELVAACATMFREWQPDPAPTWVTCIPSLRHPDLVPSFAQRLAAALNLPFYATLRKTDNRPEQKTMANSIQQARNIDGSLAINRAAKILSEPVLLVDDMVDSRWTLTIAAWLLRHHGSGKVFPLALAQTGKD